jgi:hypothetical protein
MRRRLEVAVGQEWPDELEVVELNGKTVVESDSEARTRLANSLALGAGLLMVAFAGYGMVRGDGALIDRIFNLVEWALIWLLGWAVGRSHG